jgi:hypothetical protein
VIPEDGLPHLLAVTQTAGTVVFYVDGVAVANMFTSTSPPSNTMTQAGINGPFPGNGIGEGTCDEWAVWQHVLSPADIASLQAARGSFGAYSAAVQALSPTIYYHLDDDSTALGRTPVLEVTNGTHAVGDFTNSFPAVTTPGPFRYSWIVGLGNAAQTLFGQLTSTPLPPLILPGGYTVGTFTPDLTAGDQWSNISLWWNDSLQALLQGTNAFDYGDGAYLVYHQIGT